MMTVTATRLNSWKEIAAYLGCDVSTAQRWEKERSLPVRRVPGGKRQSVFAVTDELDDWLAMADQEAEPAADQQRISRRRYAIVAIVGSCLLLLTIASVIAWLKPRHTITTPRNAYPRIAVPAAFLAVVADLNEDGLSDIVLSGMPSRLVTTVLGNGKGGASSVLASEACDQGWTLATADFDGDGHVDVAAGCGGGNVSVFWGSGSGVLSNRSDVAFLGDASVIASADFDGDGAPDLLAAGAEKMVILLSRKRTFSPVYEHATGARITYAAVGDFNGDGLPDVLIPLVGTGALRTIIPFINTGGGKMRKLDPMTLRSATGFVAVADFNEDGHLDVVLGGFEALSVLLGTGDGRFREGAPLATYRGAGSVPAVADFNGDGHMDIAVAERSENSVQFYYGRGNGEFDTGQRLDFGSNATAVAVGDFNRDGRPDIAVSLTFEPSLSIVLNPFVQK